MTGFLEKRRGGHSAMSNADLRRCAPAPLHGSSEVGEISTDLLSRCGCDSIRIFVMPNEIAHRGSIESKLPDWP